MNAVDYAPTSRRAAAIALLDDPRIRRAAAACGAGLLALAAVAISEAARVTAAARDDAVLAARLAALEDTLAPARAVARDATRFTQLDARTRTVRASARAGANAIAALGNRLPHDVWLTTVRVTPQAIALEGHSMRLAAIGATMTSLPASSHAQARLVSVGADPVHGGISYAIALSGGT